MKVVIQRVLKASANVGETVVGEVHRGICVLVGVHRDDGPEDIDYIARKLLNLRLWEGETGRPWSLCVRDIDGGILLVSQFTLLHVLKGNKPDFHSAKNPVDAKAMFDQLRDNLRKDYREDRVQTGQFQTYQNIHIVNDGPVTIQLDSRARGPG